MQDKVVDEVQYKVKLRPRPLPTLLGLGLRLDGCMVRQKQLARYGEEANVCEAKLAIASIPGNLHSLGTHLSWLFQP